MGATKEILFAQNPIDSSDEKGSSQEIVVSFLNELHHAAMKKK
jgi:hypothetical protein